jgi:pimeloyl-ACP methyl ester carboxylesterase
LRSAALAALLLVALVALAPASAGAAPTLSACSGQDEFGCATLDVPLDRTGTTPGTVPLHYAIQRQGPKKVLIALSGGPGQSAVSSASSFAISLDPALRRYRLAVLDQRGTGKSGVLSCPNVQRLRSLDAYKPQAVANCANRIGPRRAFYTTADTVLDIDALRQALGADKIALMGISYGTNVALQYARAFPEHVDRLILD